MNRTQYFDDLIKKSGLKKVFIAKNIGISYFALQKKITGISEFKANELKIFAELVGQTTDELVKHL